MGAKETLICTTQIHAHECNGREQLEIEMDVRLFPLPSQSNLTL